MSPKKLAIGLIMGMALTHSALAEVVVIGTKQSPYRELYGYLVREVSAQGQPVKLEETRYEVILHNIHVQASVEAGSLAKPTSGEVKGVSIGGMRISLASTDLSKGVLHTKDFGKMPVYVSSVRAGLDGEFVTRSCSLVVTDQQLKAMKATGKIRPAPEDPSGLADFLKQSRGK